MPKPHLRVLKWLGSTPAIAVCSSCNHEFKVPLELLKRVAGSQEYLKLQFSRHHCTPEPGSDPGSGSGDSGANER
jgi:hypothetical protein